MCLFGLLSLVNLHGEGRALHVKGEVWEGSKIYQICVQNCVFYLKVNSYVTFRVTNVILSKVMLV